MKIIKENFHRFRSPKFLAVFAMVWVIIILFSGIRFGDLSGYDDAAYAHEAKVVLQTGDWLTLRLNGNPDFDKPPLFIWLLTITFKLFGQSDFTAKIPGIILGWATVVIVYFLVKELFAEESIEIRQWLAALATLCLATTQYFLKNSSHAMTDIPFTFFFTLAIYFYLKGLKNDFFLLASGVSIGLAMLIRSPMGFFPLLIIFLHLIYLRRFKLIFSFYSLGLAAFALIIPGLWYLAEFNIFGEAFIQGHFANIVAHSSDSKQTRNGLDKFLWYFEYIFLLIKLYIPWFPFSFYGLFISTKKWWVEKTFSAEPLLLIWLLVVLIPFSLAESKVLRYILPIFPILSVYAALTLFKLIRIKYLPIFSQTVATVLLFAGVFIVVFPTFQERAADMKIIAPLSDSFGNTNERVILYTFGDFHWNYQTQLLWYGNRNTLLVKDFTEIEKVLSEKAEITVVMDKKSFRKFEDSTNLHINIIGESEHFICFSLSSINLRQ